MMDHEKMLQKIDKAHEFVFLEDGFTYYWPKKGGAISAAQLRAIADELDRRNAKWEEAMNKFFDGTK